MKKKAAKKKPMYGYGTAKTATKKKMYGKGGTARKKK